MTRRVLPGDTFSIMPSSPEGKPGCFLRINPDRWRIRVDILNGDFTIFDLSFQLLGWNIFVEPPHKRALVLYEDGWKVMSMTEAELLASMHKDFPHAREINLSVVEVGEHV